MAIKPPAWCSGAVPTPQGWRDARTNELLKAMKISQGDIDAFYGKTPVVEPEIVETAPPPVVEDEVHMEQLNEAPVNDKSIYEMTKFELEALGRQHGVELDRRKTKNDLIEEMEEIIELNEQYS
jgi:hypothetical protein